MSNSKTICCEVMKNSYVDIFYYYVFVGNNTEVCNKTIANQFKQQRIFEVSALNKLTADILVRYIEGNEKRRFCRSF